MFIKYPSWVPFHQYEWMYGNENTFKDWKEDANCTSCKRVCTGTAKLKKLKLTSESTPMHVHNIF
jgi:hypothetical protein